MIRAFALLPLTAIYYILCFIWDAYWKRKPPVRIDSKVISVGNITVGGSGKTTLAGFICRYLLERGKRTALVARGYGRPESDSGICGDADSVSWERYGDEPAALAKSVPGLKIYVDSDKTKAAERAASDGIEYVVVDDGFQHRRLHRDSNIVCLDARRPFGNGLLLPSGRLREPRRSLKRADVMVVIDGSSRNRPQLGNLKASVFFGKKIMKGARSQNGNPANIHGSRLIAFCGLANPESFFGTLMDAEYQIIDFVKFRDHHVYTARDIRKIEIAAERTHCDAAVTTLKDAVKLERIWTSRLPLYYLEIALELENENELLRLIGI